MNINVISKHKDLAIKSEKIWYLSITTVQVMVRTVYDQEKYR